MTVETQCPAERERSCRRCWQIRSLGTTQCHLHSSVSADFTLCPPLSFSLELQLDDTLLACLISSLLSECQTEFILSSRKAWRRMFESLKHLQPDMLLCVPSKTTEVTHIDLWGSVTPNLSNSFLVLASFWLSVSSPLFKGGAVHWRSFKRFTASTEMTHGEISIPFGRGQYFFITARYD